MMPIGWKLARLTEYRINRTDPSPRQAMKPDSCAAPNRKDGLDGAWFDRMSLTGWKKVVRITSLFIPVYAHSLSPGSLELKYRSVWTNFSPSRIWLLDPLVMSVI